MGALPQPGVPLVLKALPVSHAIRSRVENAVTLEEIARLAGVSRSTVSRVVNADRRYEPINSKSKRIRIAGFGYRWPRLGGIY